MEDRSHCPESDEIEPRRSGWAVAGLARRQHGVIAHRQLRALGFSRAAISRRVGGGHLHPVFRGVYSVGHGVVSADGRRSAAVLATGAGAALSHRSAGALLGLRPSSAAIETVIDARGGRSREGIKVHRVSSVDARDVLEERGVPCTSVPRTLIDLAAVLGPEALERAVERAEILRVLDLDAVQEATDRLRGRRGVARLRLALERFLPDAAFTRSELERRFLSLCRDASIPPPLVNALVDVGERQLEVDFSWPKVRLAVEVDGFETHGTRTGFERDRERGQLLTSAGWRTASFTWRQVREGHGAAATMHALFRNLPAEDRIRLA